MKSIVPVLSAAALLLAPLRAGAHCEVPCGIYDDEARVEEMLEHAATIEKAMGEIVRLEKEAPGNKNQIVRWVVNKESHAGELQHIVSQYFLTQRIKPDAADYEKKLALLHGMLLAAMKCKQTVETSHVEKLRSLIEEFRSLYFAAK